jgi:uncharacterized protein YjdB/fibronectin type 3 domain-containing protein
MNIMKRSFLLTLIILSLIFSSFPTNIMASAKGDFFTKNAEKNNPKLGPSINSAVYGNDPLVKAVQRVKKDKERLHVYVEFNHRSVIDVLEQFGNIKNLNEELGLAEITLSASEIEGLLDNPNILSIREVMKPIVNRGYSMTDAFYDVGGQGINSYLKLNSKAGDNIKIGVISDGVGGLDNAISRGEIPTSVVILSNTVGGAEGTAMLEVIHDLAPNAQLYFHDCGESSLDFINSVNALAAQGVDIIVDDIVYLDEPFFEDSNIAKHINQLVTSTGILYISSAGNFAQSHVQSLYRPVLRNSVFEHDFSSAETGVQRMPILVPAQSSVVVMLQWNEPFNNSAKDLDLAVCSDNSTDYCYVSDSYQLGSGYSPVEYVELINTNYNDMTQYVTVYSETALTNLTFEIYLFGGSTVQKYGTRTDSTFGHSTAANVLSIAAIDADSYSVFNLSSYSSQGPFTMVNGTTRNKPDFTAYDCVDVSGSGGFPNVFCGTSAASAHIGAIAALIKSNNTSFTRTQLIDAMKAKSYDLSTIGYDYQSGNGLVHLGVYGPELTFQKSTSTELRFIFDKPGKFTFDNTSILSILSTSVQTFVYNGVTYYSYIVGIKALIDGTTTLRFTTTTDSKELYRHKMVVSNRLLDFEITDSTTAYLQLNQSMKFGLYLSPENANNATFSYTSSNPTIATVDTAGNIVAKTAGSTKITIKHSATGMMVSGTVKTGILSTGLSILPAQPTVTVGQTIQLSTLFTPSNATYKEVKWSSYSAILSVDTNGLATGVTPGTVTVYADSVDGRSTASVRVTVVEPLTAIEFEKPQYTYYFSGTNTWQLNLIKTPADSNETGLLWQSSNPQVMDVSQEGILTIKSLGTSEITVSGPRGLFASTIVNVEPQAYTNHVNVERNGVLTYSAFSLKGTYGQTLTLAQLRMLYDQAMGSPAGVNVHFFERIGDQYFGITSDYVFMKNETLLAVEIAIPIKSLTITDVSIVSNTLTVNGRFEPNRPADIRYRYIISDPTVLRPILDFGSSMCTLEETEYACLPGRFEILKSGTVSLTVESFDGKFKDTIRINISGEPGNYSIDNSIVRSLNVSSIKSDSLELKWSAVELAAGYEIYRSTAADGPFEKVADVVSALQYTDIGRTLNQPTYYKVRAYMLVGDEIVFGDYSEVMVGRTRPDPLTTATVTHLDRLSLQLNVKPDPKISVVQWAYSRHPEGPYTVLSESNNFNQIVSNLAIGMTYYFKVRYASDTSFGRVYSDYSEVILQHPIPKIPTLTVTPVNTSKIRLQIVQEQGAIYQFYSIKNGKEELIHQSSMYIFEYTDIGPGEEVGFKARVFIPYNNKDVYSLFSPVQTIKMAPETVKDLHPSIVEISSITVAWSASPKAAGYEVSQSLSSGSGYSVIADTTQLSHRATGLEFNTTYYYRVRSYVIINNTKIYGEYSTTTNGHTQVPYVQGLNAKSLSYNSNRIEWSKVDLASGYDIYYSKGTSTSYVLLKSQTTIGFTHTALVTNTKYNYKIRAYYLVGTTKVYGQFSLSVSATPLTAAPVATVTSTGYNSLKVSYPAVAGASGYEISYSLSETGTYTKLPLTTALSVNITNTQTNRTYYVKVRAYRTVNYVKIYGHTALSTGKSIPSAPSLTLTSGGYDAIRATWGAVAGASGYQLYVLEGSSFKFLADTTSLTYTDTGKQTGQDVTYKVLAYRLVDGNKVYSNETRSVGRAVPAGTTDMKVSASNVFALTMTWTAVAGATGYEISQSTTSTGTYTVVGDVSTTTFTKASLSFNKVYYYKVRAYRTVGSVKHYGPMSSVFSGKTALLPVSGVSAGYTSYNTNVVQWQPVEGASGYAIYYSKGTSTTYSFIKYQTATSLTHASLTTNTKYNYKVRAYRMVGTTRVFGAYSTVASSTPLPMPPVISVASAGYNSLNVSWPAVAGASGYEVSYSYNASGPFTVLPLTTKTGAVVPNLSTNVAVFVRVRTYRTVSYVKRFGNYSAVVSGVAIPSAPVLALSSNGYDSINVGWAAVAGASGYEVYVLDGEYRLLSDTAALNVVDGGKVTGVETTYKVRAYRLVNNVKVFGPESIGKTRAVPSLPAGFKVSLVDITSLSLVWGAVSGASGYEISQATTSTGTYTVVGDVSATEFKKTGLTFNRTYYYKIRAYTLVNSIKIYGSLSASISGKTVPSPVVLTVTPQTGRVNALTWEPINGANGYQIYYSTGTSTSYSLLTTVTSSSYSHKALVLGRKYNYRVRAYRMSGTTRIYGDYSPVTSAVAIN